MIVAALETLAYGARAVSTAAWRAADRLALAPARERWAAYALLAQLALVWWAILAGLWAAVRAWQHR